MDAISPISAAMVTPVVVAPTEMNHLQPPDTVAVEKFAAKMQVTAENTLGAIGPGIDESAAPKLRDASVRSMSVGASGEAQAGVDTPYDRVFRFFTGSQDPLMGELNKTREMLGHDKPIDSLSDLYRMQQNAMQASAELTMLSVKTSLLMQAGFEGKKSVEKLVQQQG